MISYDPKNWLRVLLDFPRSPVFRTLFLDVLGAGAYAAFVVWIERDVVRVAVPLGPAFLSILGIILGLLLVFRTNTAYDRWWEGRRLWGQLVNLSRGISHQLDALLPQGAVTARTLYREQISSLAESLAEHLRRPRVAGSAHRPNAWVSKIHRELEGDREIGVLPADTRIALAPLLQGLDDVIGGCERIRNTPIPFSYSSYIKQFVLLYALVMPFGLVNEFGYGTVIASMFTFFATMGIELLAGEVEEPFGTDRNDLPLDDIARVIRNDVTAILTPDEVGA